MIAVLWQEMDDSAVFYTRLLVVTARSSSLLPIQESYPPSIVAHQDLPKRVIAAGGMVLSAADAPGVAEGKLAPAGGLLLRSYPRYYEKAYFLFQHH